MLLQKYIKAWVIATLKNDATFTQLCIDTIGSALNFSSSSPMNNNNHFQYPSCEVYSDETMKTYDSNAPYNKVFTIPIAIAIEVEKEPVITDDVNVWESTDKVELIASSAEEILRKEVMGCGINGYYGKLLSSELQISEIGESTQDVQAAMWIQIGLHNNI